jgi:hypothetical protein
MKLDKVVSLAEYKARCLTATKRLTHAGVEKTLPEADCLWELLDRNIKVSVWEEGN